MLDWEHCLNTWRLNTQQARQPARGIAALIMIILRCPQVRLHATMTSSEAQDRACGNTSAALRVGLNAAGRRDFSALAIAILNLVAADAHGRSANLGFGGSFSASSELRGTSSWRLAETRA